MVSDGQRPRNARKQQQNTELSILPKFCPLNPYRIYYINRTTSTMLMYDLITLARTTSRFTIDTEKDFYSHAAALIQIEFIGNDSIILLIETCHLPDVSSVLFWLIRSLLKVILAKKNLVYCWGDICDELLDFIPTNLVSLELLRQINYRDVQHQFKVWCRRTFSEDDLNLCIKNSLVGRYACTVFDDVYHKWSLQMAITFTFDEFLDKSLTKRHWSRPLDGLLASACLARSRSDQAVAQRIEYAVNNCLAVTKLARMLGISSIKEPTRQRGSDGNEGSRSIVDSSSIKQNTSATTVGSSHDEGDSRGDQLVPVDDRWKVAAWKNCYVRLVRCKATMYRSSSNDKERDEEDSVDHVNDRAVNGQLPQPSFVTALSVYHATLALSSSSANSRTTAALIQSSAVQGVQMVVYERVADQSSQ
ncbi:unnamed protein product [Rotaria socialis]|uniref:3'-5' exonuclease domain-containing protein n=1 Tax=Rotaria socialis TaxID=392032 RepID=A0A818AUX2_9BILA|nr:unnamed protein product [Rotaria socialis]CAF4504444.1 unnamed protein product [Rotaria socialis]